MDCVRRRGGCLKCKVHGRAFAKVVLEAGARGPAAETSRFLEALGCGVGTDDRDQLQVRVATHLVHEVRSDVPGPDDGHAEWARHRYQPLCRDTVPRSSSVMPTLAV